MSSLKTLREQQNLTQEELSKKSGVSTRTIQRIETGKEIIKIETTKQKHQQVKIPTQTKSTQSK